MPGQFRVTPVDVAGSVAKGAQARNALNQLREGERLTESRNKLAGLLSGGTPTDPAGQQRLIGAAAQVSPEMAFKVESHLKSLAPDLLKQRTEEAPLIIGLFSDVNDDQTYQIARNEALKFGIDDLPGVYDQNALQATLHGYRALVPGEKDRGFTLGEGQVRYDQAGNVLARGPEKTAKPPAPSNLSKLLAERDALPAGDPRRAAYDRAIEKTTSPSAPLVNMGALETEEAKAFGKSLVANYDDVQKRASVAEDTLAQIAIARSIPVETGASAPLKSAIAAIAQGFGFSPESVGLDQAAGAQALTAVMNNLVLNKMQAQKGPQTENDAARIEATLARLGNTPAANDFLFRSAEALEVRAVEQARFYRAFRQEKGTLDGAASAWDKHKRETPLVGTHPETKQPVFYHEFERLVERANRGASRQQILRLWRDKYDG